MRSAISSEASRAMSTTSSRYRCSERKPSPVMFQCSCLPTRDSAVTSVRTFCRLPARTSEALKPVDSTVMMNLLYVSFRCGVGPCGAVPFRHIHDGPLVPQFLALSTV